jgi:catechol 2,3-dioxygenase-like lactoylglutathione lyase family enzyme
MKVNSISGVTYHVKDLERTAEFYETIGFRRGKDDEAHVTFYVNWFFVTFIAQDKEDHPEFRKEAKLKTKGTGTFLYVKVDDVEKFHKEAVSKGLEPLSEPERRPSGNREFVLRDPDGYKLVFFQKK